MPQAWTCAGSIPAHASFIFTYCPGGEIGRRKRLKISRQQCHAGSIPALGTRTTALKYRTVMLVFPCIHTCPGGEIGRRTCLRSKRGDPCWFKSSPGHIQKQETKRKTHSELRALRMSFSFCFLLLYGNYLVHPVGFGPTTVCLRGNCSTN